MLETFDERWLQSLHQACPSSWQTPMEIITQLGSSGVLGGIVSLVAGVLIFQKQTKNLIFLAAAGIASQVLNESLKSIVRRPRPKLWQTHLPLTYSFPSGHALGSMLVFGALAYLAAQKFPNQKWWIGSAALLITLFVGFSRLYLGVHWPTDVLAGWAIGGVALAGLIYWHKKSNPPTE